MRCISSSLRKIYPKLNADFIPCCCITIIIIPISTTVHSSLHNGTLYLCTFIDSQARRIEHMHTHKHSHKSAEISSCLCVPFRVSHVCVSVSVCKVEKKSVHTANQRSKSGNNNSKNKKTK